MLSPVISSLAPDRYSPITAESFSWQSFPNLSSLPSVFPPPLSVSSVGHVKLKKLSPRDFMEGKIHKEYPRVLEMVKKGTSAKKAIDMIDMARSSFYKWRFVAELKLVDSSYYHNLKEQFKSATIFCSACKEQLLDGTLSVKAEQMRRSQELLPISM